MPSSKGLHPSRSFKLTNPVFNRQHRAPPIHSLLNSSGDSTGGSSEASSIDDSSYSTSTGFVDEVLGRKLSKSRIPPQTDRQKRRQSLSSISSLSDVENFSESEQQGHTTKETGQSLGPRSNLKKKGPLTLSNNSLECLSISPYQVVLNAMESDPKWRSERNQGRMVGMYKICGEIGSGNFAKVRLGIHQLTKEKVAVKIIDKSRVEPKLEKMLSREISCMESLYHPNIVRLYEVIETPGKLYLISEWAPVGDLYCKVTLRGRLAEAEAKPIFKQILSALTFMHSNGIVHRDLKAENIFFATGTHCKVGDFGFATTAIKGQMLSTFCGSPPYAAPELFRDESYEGAPVDVWALGVLLYFMIEGTLPFVGTSIPSLKKAILDGQYQLSPNISTECLDIIQGILQQRPFARLTISRIIRHPWLQQFQSSLTSRSTPMERTISSDHPGNTNVVNDLRNSSTVASSSFDEDMVHPKQQRQHELLCRQDTTAILLPATKNRALSKSIPTREQLLYGLLSQPELKALEILKEIGINDAIIEAHRARGVKSHVIGIYRIILHKIQEGRGINLKQFNFSSCSSSTSLVSEKNPLGLKVPSSSSSIPGSGRGVGHGQQKKSGGLMRNSVPIRKQFAVSRAYDEETVNQSTTCSIL